ncbi:MAG: alpha/beta hydrolase [Candidatus Nealsonbacteria bacterium]|nr:alpha/beta hydrolase [Candidatus Nealsonbacteria bacterium]
MRRAALLTLTVLATVGLVRHGRAGQNSADVGIRVEHDAEAFVTTVNIPAPGGQVTWADVTRGLARARGYDDSALAGSLPKGSIDLSLLRWQLTLVGLNVALKPDVHFDAQQIDPDGNDWRLVIKLDRAALSASQRRFKAKLRNALMSLRPDRRTYGLIFDENWDRTPAERNLVVLIHGLNSTPAKVDALLAGARADRLPCAVFSYPNDQPIDDSARLLSRELSRLATDHPGRGVSLVTHSMGGLLARAVIEDPELDPGNVRQLVMVAPPNHGSALARFAFGIELTEHLAPGRRKNEVGTFLAAVEDGLAEAARDLRPESPFLRTLNARTRNANVRYTIFLGTAAPLTAADLAQLRRNAAAAGQRNRWAQFFGPRVDTLLADLDETIGGKGDGVVSVARGRLDGVDDTVVLRFSHLSVLRTPADGDEREVHRGILQRLGAE